MGRRGKGRRDTTGRAGAAARRRRHTSGIPGPLTHASSASVPSLTRRALLEAELLSQVVVFKDAVVELTRGREVGGTSGPQSGQMFPGRLPATYLTSLVGDAAQGRTRTGPEERVAVRNPAIVCACEDKRGLGP